VRAPKKSGYIHSQSKRYVEEYLYDLENDVHERNNLVNHPDYLKLREELSEVLKKKMIKADEKIPLIIRKQERNE